MNGAPADRWIGGANRVADRKPDGGVGIAHLTPYFEGRQRLAEALRANCGNVEALIRGD